MTDKSNKVYVVNPSNFKKIVNKISSVDLGQKSFLSKYVTFDPTKRIYRDVSYGIFNHITTVQSGLSFLSKKIGLENFSREDVNHVLDNCIGYVSNLSFLKPDEIGSFCYTVKTVDPRVFTKDFYNKKGIRPNIILLRLGEEYPPFHSTFYPIDHRSKKKLNHLSIQ